MGTDVKATPEEKKEATAITVMRCMLVSLAAEKDIPFEQAMLEFGASKTYADLFDFETEIWKEGPEYLRSLYDEELTISSLKKMPDGLAIQKELRNEWD